MLKSVVQGCAKDARKESLVPRLQANVIKNARCSQHLVGLLHVHGEWALLQELRLLQQHCFLLWRSQGGVSVVESLLKRRKSWQKEQVQVLLILGYLW